MLLLRKLYEGIRRDWPSPLRTAAFKKKVAYRVGCLILWRVCALAPHPKLNNAATGENSQKTHIPTKQTASHYSSNIRLPPPCAFSLVGQEFLCAINGHMMKHPARSPHGHVFEYSTILLWLESRGRVCPFTGKPLCQGEMFRIVAAVLQTIHDWENTTTAVGTPT